MSNLIPDGWNYQPLSSLAEIDKGSLKGSTDPAYQFKYVDIASVSTGQICLPTEYISFGEAPSRARKKIRCGDVLMSTVRPNLKSFAYFDTEGDNFVASTGFSVIRATGGNDGRFIFNSILADDITRQIEALVVGSNYPAINSSDVKNLEVLTPTKPEQQKIAAILTSVDEVIEKTQAQINKLKDLKTGMMQELLTRGVGVDGKPHTEFKDSPVGRIPKAWDVVELAELVNPKNPICYGILMPGRGVENGVPVIKVKDIRDNQIEQTGLLLTSNEIDEKYKRSRVIADDILLTIRGTTGRLAIVPTVLSGANITQDTARIRVEDSSISEYIFIYLQGPYAQKQINDHTIGQAVKGINLSEVRKINIAIPPSKELKIIAATISSLDKRLCSLLQKIEKVKNTKKALMQDLLTGKVRVKVDS